MDVIILIVLLILLGFILKYMGILPEESKRLLNTIVIYVSLPATIFSSMLQNVRAEEIPEFLKLTAFMMILSVTFVFVTLAIGRYFISDKKTLYAFSLVCCAGNTAFMGFPIILGFFGTDGLVRAIFCDVSTLIVILIVSFVLGLRLTNVKGNMFRELLKFPPLFAWIISVLLIFSGLSAFHIPGVLIQFFELLSGLTTPLIMLSVGLSLSPKYIKETFKESFAATFIKIIVMPLAAFILSTQFLFSPLEQNVFIIEAGMPPAMVIILFSEMYGMDSKFVSAATFLATVLSLFTLPILYQILINTSF